MASKNKARKKRAAAKARDKEFAARQTSDNQSSQSGSSTPAAKSKTAAGSKTGSSSTSSRSKNSKAGSGSSIQNTGRSGSSSRNTSTKSGSSSRTTSYGSEGSSYGTSSQTSKSGRSTSTGRSGTSNQSGTPGRSGTSSRTSTSGRSKTSSASAMTKGSSASSSKKTGSYSSYGSSSSSAYGSLSGSSSNGSKTKGQSKSKTKLSANKKASAGPATYTPAKGTAPVFQSFSKPRGYTDRLEDEQKMDVFTQLVLNSFGVIPVKDFVYLAFKYLDNPPANLYYAKKTEEKAHSKTEDVLNFPAYYSELNEQQQEEDKPSQDYSSFEPLYVWLNSEYDPKPFAVLAHPALKNANFAASLYTLQTSQPVKNPDLQSCRYDIETVFQNADQSVPAYVQENWKDLKNWLLEANMLEHQQEQIFDDMLPEILAAVQYENYGNVMGRLFQVFRFPVENLEQGQQVSEQVMKTFTKMPEWKNPGSTFRDTYKHDEQAIEVTNDIVQIKGLYEAHFSELKDLLGRYGFTPDTLKPDSPFSKGVCAANRSFKGVLDKLDPLNTGGKYCQVVFDPVIRGYTKEAADLVKRYGRPVSAVKARSASSSRKSTAAQTRSKPSYYDEYDNNRNTYDMNDMERDFYQRLLDSLMKAASTGRSSRGRRRR